MSAGQAEELSPEEQKELESALKRMEDAFHNFHKEMTNVKLEQKQIAREISKRIDQEKIEKIRQTLQQS